MLTFLVPRRMVYNCYDNEPVQLHVQLYAKRRKPHMPTSNGPNTKDNTSCDCGNCVSNPALLDSHMMNI
ncbi:hypothetical protein GE061_015715 [Apolygus lucorum]|uniref:Uncharacterized protein n=1 Tax=Apolygus lucorum TaxID=248454 RepID=A0A8S9XLR7_APOLU|nr:hypothetical protein GE061_015715 [Apolygus lucorum]